MSYANDVIHQLTIGDWKEADNMLWPHMTSEERNQLAAQVLNDAREAVDDQYEMKQAAKEAALKVAMALLTKLI